MLESGDGYIKAVNIPELDDHYILTLPHSKGVRSLPSSGSNKLVPIHWQSTTALHHAVINASLYHGAGFKVADFLLARHDGKNATAPSDPISASHTWRTASAHYNLFWRRRFVALAS